MKIILSIALLISLNVHAGTTTKREFIKDGIVYVETTTIEKNGFTSVETLPKKGQDITTVKQVATKNGGVKTTISTKNVDGASTLVINNNKEVEAKSKKMYNEIAKCDLKLLASKTPMGMYEMQTHGFIKDSCKFTQKITAAAGTGQLVTCLFTKEHLKEIEIKGIVAFTQFQTNENVCTITGLDGKKFN